MKLISLPLKVLWWHSHSLMVDYSLNCSIDWIPAHILSLPLINQINTLHIFRHDQITSLVSFFFSQLSLMMDALPSIFSWSLCCLPSSCVHCSVQIFLSFCFSPCMLFNPPSLELFHFPVIPIRTSTLMILFWSHHSFRPPTWLPPPPTMPPFPLQVLMSPY